MSGNISRRCRFALALIPAILALALPGGAGTPPHIDRIERYLTNGVTIHFDTAANLTYVLQFKDTASTSITWSNLTTIPALPFPSHYVLVDSATNAHRFYRLFVHP